MQLTLLPLPALPTLPPLPPLPALGVTPWFPMNRPPVHAGPYDVQYRSKGTHGETVELVGRYTFNGKQWASLPATAIGWRGRVQP